MDQITEIVDIVMVLACISLLFFLGINARILPTWMFLNSIQLIMHTVLLSTSMPSNLHYFLMHYLNLIRMSPPSYLEPEMEVLQYETDQNYYELSNKNDSSYSSVIRMCGYKHTFSQNLIIVIGFTLLLVTATVVISLVDFVCRRRGNRRCSAYICNFNVRFFYELILEICLSVLIHVASMQTMPW